MLHSAKRHFNELTFSEKVVLLSSLVPKGMVVTYGDLAKAAGGGAMAAQSVTAILSKASVKKKISIPFHRIVYSDGRVWLDAVSRESRLKLYKKEKITVNEKDMVADFSTKRFDFRTIQWEKLKEAVMDRGNK